MEPIKVFQELFDGIVDARIETPPGQFSVKAIYFDGSCAVNFDELKQNTPEKFYELLECRLEAAALENLRGKAEAIGFIKKAKDTLWPDS